MRPQGQTTEGAENTEISQKISVSLRSLRTLTVAKAQLAVSGETGKYPEFEGNVKTVDIRDFWRDASISPRNQGYHYNQNAETYMLVGEALGRAMVELKEHTE